MSPSLCTEEGCDEPMGDNDRDLCAGCFDSWLSGQEDRADYGGDSSIPGRESGSIFKTGHGS